MSDMIPNTGTQNGMYFTSYIFDPDPERPVTIEDLVEILKALDIHMTSDAFYTRIPDTVKKHFVVADRYGGKERFNRRKHSPR